MKTYPLESISIHEAKQKQFEIIDAVMKEFKGTEFLNMGDLGISPSFKKPLYTKKVEKVIARVFESESCSLVTGAGTGALRCAIQSIFKPKDKILVHTSPIYPSSLTTLEGLDLTIVRADFHRPEEILKTFRDHPIDGVLIQHTRQIPTDSYRMEEVISTIKSVSKAPIITDDNYAVMKVGKIGVQCGAHLSTFSSFKLQGPEGVGVVVGKEKYLKIIDSLNYSGGSKVQGHQAMEVLRGLVIAPVLLAIQAEQNDIFIEKIKQSRLPEIKQAFLVNAQSKVVLVEFTKDMALEVLAHAEKLGALPYPVGAESKYELPPMFYRVSGTFLKDDPSLEKRMIRINLNRGSAETAFRILTESIQAIKDVY